MTKELRWLLEGAAVAVLFAFGCALVGVAMFAGMVHANDGGERIVKEIPPSLEAFAKSAGWRVETVRELSAVEGGVSYVVLATVVVRCPIEDDGTRRRVKGCTVDR